MLAGGAGTRLGGSKASVRLAGRPLIAYPLAALAAAGLDPVVVAKPQTELPELGAEVLREAIATRHPLAGIVTALRQLEAPVVVCACDMPFVTAALAELLAGVDASLAVPEARGRTQPLLARYTPAVLGQLERALAAQEPLRGAVAGLKPRIVPERELVRLGDPARMLANVNTPSDLAAAEAELASS